MGAKTILGRVRARATGWARLGSEGGLLRRVGISAAVAALALVAFAATASAAPAAPITFELTQPDGTTFTARQYGDELANGVETARGYTILQDRQGVWRYAQRAAGGALVAGALRADTRTAPALPLHIRPSASAAATDLSRSMAGSATGSALARTEAGTASPAGSSLAANGGSQADVVLLVRFKNQAPAAGSTPAAWHAKYFGSANSVRDFYAHNSYGKFRLDPATETSGTRNDGVVGWLTLNMNHPNSRGNPGSPKDVKVFRAAVAAASKYLDFASYDANRDGYLAASELHVTVILAGYEAAYSTTCGNSVWSHHMALSSEAESASADGVVIGDGAAGGGYTEFGEQQCARENGVRKSRLATIGIMAHEFGHELGLPDLYDVDYSSYGVGDWSLMSLGAWNAVGNKPLGSSPSMLDAWSKWAEGWITPVRVDGSVRLAPAETSASVLQLLPDLGGVDTAGSGEYFLVENRQRVGYDAGLPGCGVLVWHIDESRADNSRDSHRMVDLVEADGHDDLDRAYGSAGNAGDAGDAFPGTAHRRTFTRKTDPSSKLYGGTASGVSMKSISASCGVPAATLKVSERGKAGGV